MREFDEAAEEIFARLEAEQRRKHRRLRRLGYASAAMTMAMVVAGAALFAGTHRQRPTGPIAGAQNPPDAGTIGMTWAPCRAYDEPVRPAAVIHSLAHGAVWIAYRPGTEAEQVTRLRQLAQRETYVIVSPFQNLAAPVVASAWNRQLHLCSPDDPRLAGFVREFRLGDQAPQRGGPC